MNQSGFDFTVPPVDPHQEPVRPAVPIAPAVDPTAKHCSSMGAQKAEESRDNLWRKMLWLYRIGPRTDAGLALILGVAPSTISARRSELIKQGLVDPQSCGTRKNEKSGVSNTLWQLRKDR